MVTKKEDLRFCANCRYYRKLFLEHPNLCFHPSEVEQGSVDIETGRIPRPTYPYAKRMRSRRGACGPEGKLYEERLPWWRRLMNWRKR